MRPHLIFGPKYFWEIGPPLFQGLDDRPSLIVRCGSVPTREDILLFSNEAMKIALVKLLKIIAGF